MSNTTIQIRRSTTTAIPPSLANGELAFSGVSNSLYIGMPDGSAVSPAIGGVMYPYLASAVVGVVTPNSVLIANSTAGIANLSLGDVALGTVYANGSQGTTGQVLASNGTTVYWASNTPPDLTLTNDWSNTQIFSGNVTVNSAVTVTAASGLALADGVVYNNAGVLTTNSALTFNEASGNLEVGNNVNATSLSVGTTVVANATGITLANDKGVRLTSVNATAFSRLVHQSDDNLVLYSTNTSGLDRAIFSIFANSVTSNLGISVGLEPKAGVVANGSLGTAGQTLASNGSSVYWVTGMNTTIYTKEWHVDPVNGTDAAGTAGNLFAPFKTLTYALTRAGGTGEKIFLHQGTYTGENPIITDLNIDIEGTGLFGSGTTFLPGTLTVNAVSTASSVRIRGLYVNNFVHSGSAGVYIQDLQTRSTLTKSGSGYLEVRDCDLQGLSFTGVTTISGNGYSNFYRTKVGTTLVTNAAAIVTMKDIPSILAGGITVSTGATINLDEVIGVAASSTANAIAAAAGSVVYISDSDFYTPTGTSAKIALNGFYSVKGVTYNETTSTFGTSLSAVSHTDNLHALASIRVANSFIANTTKVTFTGANIDATSATLNVLNAVVAGNLTVNGTTTTLNTTTLTVNDPLIKLANGNATDTVDIGMYGVYGSAYAGLFRDASDTGVFKLFQGLTTEPTTTVDTTAGSYAIGTLNAYLSSGAFVSNSTAVAITANSTVAVSIVANTLTLTSPLDIASGGTGRSTIGPDGSILQSNGTALVYLGIDGGTY